MNLTFYPGPSKLYPSVEKHLSEAYRSGILSMNHRSGAFMDLLSQTILSLKHKLNIPPEYEVYFTSSATECWEIISQSLVQAGSLHCYNGAFGQKWHEYSSRLTPACQPYAFDLNEEVNSVPDDLLSKAEVLCLTHSETSNGTALSDRSMATLRHQFGGVIAVDATSSMAGLALPWLLADVWFASVQKCFGLPSGLGILVVSPKAIRKAEQKGDRAYYNSLLFIRDNFLKNQTPFTPNILGIYLLGKIMEEVAYLDQVAAKTQQRANAWYQFLSENTYSLLVENPEVRSQTVIAVEGEARAIQKLKEAALREGILLGSGYGKWKTTTVRIANFPAISEKDIGTLMAFLQNNISQTL